MNPEEDKKINNPEEAKAGPIVHTYQEDLSRAMNATDASVVQELLATAREKETIAKDEEIKQKQRGWYVTGSVILILFALAAAAYGVYHYTRLTVPVSRSLSVGVFPSTGPVVAEGTTIKDVVETFKSTTLPERKPHLIPIVTDAQTLTLLSMEEFFSFIEAIPSEPFRTSMDNIRLGVVNMGEEVETFIIASTPNPEIAPKEYLISEGELIRMFYKALGIDVNVILQEVGKGYGGEYMYNLPVRTLKRSGEHVILYGYATDNVIVIATKPEVLKSVYDTIIRQR